MAKITKKYVTPILIFTILFIAPRIVTSEIPHQTDRNQLFNETFNQEKERILALPAYEATRARFVKFLNEIEQFKALKIKEMHNDQEYQRNFAEIRNEIEKSGMLSKQTGQLTDAECAYLVIMLTKQFIPE